MEPLPPDGPRTPRFVVLHPRRPPWAPVCVAAVLVATVMAGQVAAAGLPTELGLLAGAVLALPALPVLRLAQCDAQRTDGMAWAYGALVILLAGVGLGFLARYVLLVTLDVPSGLGALVVLAGTVLAAAVALTLARAAALVVNRRAGVPADTRSTAGLGTVVSAIAETVALTTAALLLWPLAAPVWFVVAASLVAWSALAGALAWIMATDLDVLQKPDPARST